MLHEQSFQRGRLGPRAELFSHGPIPPHSLFMQDHEAPLSDLRLYIGAHIGVLCYSTHAANLTFAGNFKSWRGD